MHRIESPGATQDNRWTEGDPASGTPATQISAAFMNAIQSEIVKVVEAAGLTLQSAETETGDQLLAALQKLGLGGYATAVEAQALTSLTKLLTPGRFPDSFNALEQQLAVGQTWQNLAGSRSPGVTYTNTTGKPILALVTSGSILNASITAYVDGVVVGEHRSNEQTNISERGVLTLLVPDGSTYKVEKMTDAFIVRWAELR